MNSLAYCVAVKLERNDKSFMLSIIVVVFVGETFINQPFSLIFEVKKFGKFQGKGGEKKTKEVREKLV
jgi:hypothetical protein